MACMSATEQVFNTPELVISIIIQAELSALELLRLRRVNRRFGHVVLNAKLFRQDLFLDVELPPTELSAIKFNPLLEKMFPPCKKSYFDNVFARTPVPYQDEREHFVTEGRICKGCYSTRMNLIGLPDQTRFVHFPILETMDVEDYFSPEQWDEHAIWRNMYATRPVLPIHVVDSTPLCHRRELEPMTMGKLMDELIEGKLVFSTAAQQRRALEEKKKAKVGSTAAAEGLFASLLAT